jgi:16S rRNA (cytidine1402-2'-O)-methyltransferase
VVFFESPHKFKKTLKDMLQVFGDIEISIARELTKIHEEIKQGSLQELIDEYSEKKVKGEIVILFSLK